MRKPSLTFLMMAACLLMVCTVPLRAQLITYGGYAGLNFSNLSVSDLDPGQIGDLDPDQVFNSRTGFMLGGWLGININRTSSLQLMGYFTRKGADIAGTGSSSSAIETDYFQFPLVAYWDLGIQLLRPHLYLGPAVSFLTRCKLKALSEDVDCSESFDTQNANFSGIIGGGVWVGPIRLAVQYDIGFSNLSGESGNGSVKNRTWTILVGSGR